MSKPVAVPESLICSECGLDWDDHPDNPKRRDCIELLKDQWKRHTCYPGVWTTPVTPTPTTAPWYVGDMTWTNTGSNVTAISGSPIFSDEDDPDMGVAAIVS